MDAGMTRMDSTMPSDTPTPADFSPSDYRILVVDDDPSSPTLKKMILGRAGYQVELAHDGLKGLAMLEAQHFDLAIVDTMMPGMDGFEMVQHIRRQSRFDTMLVVIAGFGEAERESSMAIKVGADDYWTALAVMVPRGHLESAVHDLLVRGRRHDMNGQHDAI